MIIKLVILISALTSLVVAEVSFFEQVNSEIMLELTCDSEHEGVIDFTKSNVVSNDSITAVKITNCSFPADGFRVKDFLSNLDLKNISLLLIQNPPTSLKRRHLRGLSVNSLHFLQTDEQKYSDDLLEGVGLIRKLTITGGLTRLPKYLNKSLPGLERLDIRVNNLEKINSNDFASLTDLTELHLPLNSIKEIEEGAFNGIENLKVLELDYNKIKSLPETLFHKLKNLQKVYLNSNRLTALPAELFKGLRNLEYINLKSNRLTSLPEGIFDDATKLKELNLEKNNLNTLPENIFSKNKLDALYLNGNNLTNITAEQFLARV